MFDSSLCADEKPKHPSWWPSISRPIPFHKYFTSQFNDIWSWFVLLVQRESELNGSNHRSALQKSDGNSPKSRISVNLPVFFSSFWNAFFCRFERNYWHYIALHHNLILHLWQEASNTFINNTLMSMSALV